MAECSSRTLLMIKQFTFSTWSVLSLYVFILFLGALSGCSPGAGQQNHFERAVSHQEKGELTKAVEIALKLDKDFNSGHQPDQTHNLSEHDIGLIQFYMNVKEAGEKILGDAKIIRVKLLSHQHDDSRSLIDNENTASRSDSASADTPEESSLWCQIL